MADSWIVILDADGIVRKIDNELIGDVYRQRTQVCGNDLAEVAAVQNSAPAGTEHALVVRPIPSGTQAVSAAALPLPTGAAEQTTLAAILAALGATLDVDASGSVVTISGTVPISVSSLPLPTGAAEQTTLAAILAALGVTLDVDASGSTVAISGTVPISAAALPLPTGAAEQATLAAMSAKLPAALIGGRLDVVVGAALPAGTNNIGDVDLASALPAGTNNIGDVDVLTIPARARTTDSIAVALQTDAIMAGSAPLTPKFAALSETASGEAIAAVTSKKIRVLAMVAVANVDGTFNFRDGAAGAALTGVMTVRQGGGFVLPFNPVGWFETTSGTRLDVVLATVTQLSGSITYVEV